MLSGNFLPRMLFLRTQVLRLELVSTSTSFSAEASAAMSRRVDTEAEQSSGARPSIVKGRFQALHRGLRAIAIASFVTAAGVPAASARPRLEQTSPAVGSTVRHGPPRVTLSFDEALLPAGSDAVVRDASGGVVSSGKARVFDKARLQVPVRSLAPGKYRVEWLATSADKRQKQGSFTFSVGTMETTGRGSHTSQRHRH